MLAAVRSPCRRAASKAALRTRSFATSVNAAGLRVAAFDNGQPSASVTFLVKAGTRHESKAGVAHFLKNFAFKNTANRSALRIARETELYGGILSSSLGREHLALTAEFLKGDEAYFVDLLSEVVTSTRFSRHEFMESVLPSVQAESSEASHNPVLTALDVAHSLAFRKGLGSSLVASPAGPVITEEDVKAYAHSTFTKSGLSVFGTGIDSATLAKLVEKSLSSLASSGSSASASATKYFGGESRVLLESHGPQTIFIGYGSASAVTPELQVLAAHLTNTPSIKWSEGAVSTFSNMPHGASVQTVLLPYSDATLFGFLIQAPTSETVHQAGKSVVAALKDVSGSFKGDALKRAIAKAKMSSAAALETRQGLLDAISLDSNTTLESAFTGIEKVSAQTAGSAASSLTKSKPVYVAVGDVHSLPHADELGL
ncbi:probable QCR2-40 kDa ubiquinol cytochrome-c reductase core protein 2 [Serendipita indica DSM 11827]|uniref:Cytochrome b-c1 complex subunit 2, mitochondrial n=1 Tax=Serendipita indica (strain DSM 11827) TaxID=1109443 RepID=G4TW22_SERID|nr:probable QCR2-40 kDa ubiquinol cytochrome-c reductase core protein 2 [Serendipita indica DSM 11827]